MCDPPLALNLMGDGGTNRVAFRSHRLETHDSVGTPPYGESVESDDHAWNRALRAWFYRNDLAGRPAYLAVDEDALDTISRDYHLDVGDPTRSLSEVVRRRVTERAPLGGWVAEASRWKLAGAAGDPPFLAALAITVLAATIVDDVSDRSYYRRLNGLLGLDGHGMPRDFDSDVQQLWSYLNGWLTETCGNRLGTATATNVGGLANVGWAQSQTLLRSSDRARLPLFFSAVGAQPGQSVNGSVLVDRLRSWSTGGHTFSRRLGTVLQNEVLCELLASTLHSELVHWDGTLRDESGRLLLRLLLAFHERSGDLQVASQAAEQLAGTIWYFPSTERPTKLAAAGELQILPVDVTSSVLDGEVLHATEDPRASGDSDTLKLVLPRRDVHLLCPDDRLARWVEVRSAVLHRRHLMLVRSTAEATAVEIIKTLADDVEPVRRIHRPPGWTAYRFTPDRFRLVDGPLAILSPRGNELSTLSGGLPIDRRSGLFLTSGPPDVQVDLRELSDAVTVDGTAVRADIKGHLRLEGLALREGQHTVAVGGLSYQLTLVEQHVSEPQDCQQAVSFDISDSGHGTGPATTSEVPDRPHDVTVRGAAIAVSRAAAALAPLPHPTCVRTGGRHFVLGSPGEAALIQPQPPTWLDSLPVRLAPHLIDADAALADLPFQPTWLVRASQARVTVCPVTPRATDIQRPAARVPHLSAWDEVSPLLSTAAPPAECEARWADWVQAASSAGSLPLQERM